MGSVKGREWYQEHDIAEAYDDKRFSRGGRYIDRREKAAVVDALSPFGVEHVDMPLTEETVWQSIRDT